jgi:anti-sigma B factor antagonist
VNLASESELRILWQQNGTESRAELSGKVTIDSSPELRAALLRALRTSECQRLEVDFAKVVYIDTSGVAVLVEVLRSARQLGKRAALSGLQERPRFLLESTGLLRLFEGDDAARQA